jgi:hypothetical protein
LRSGRVDKSPESELVGRHGIRIEEN